MSVLVVACAGEPASPTADRPARQIDAEEHAVSTPAARGVASLADMAGEWDIVSFDGFAPPRLDGDGKRHAYVDAGQQGLRFSIGCNLSGMPGRIEGGVLYPANVDDGMQTAMGCGPERQAREATFFRFFRSRPHVTSLPGGRLRLTSPDHALLLERSSVRRLAMGPALSEITGSWRVVGFTRYQGGGHQGWGAMFTPGRLHIADGRLSYSRCPTASVRFNYGADFVLRRADGGEPAASVACPGVRPAPTEVEPMLAALLGQSPEAERVNDKRFVLRSRDYAVVLTSDAEYRAEFGQEAASWERRPG